MPLSEPVSYPSFDAQAARYDRRTGLPSGVAAAVATAVAEVAALEPGDLVVELGAGTGQIGVRLARPPARYAGFDLSLGMLAVFRDRLGRLRAPGGGAGDRPPLVLQADGAARWPFPDGSARAVYASRAVHHLDPEHAAAEAARLAHPSGAVLLIGRVRRDPEAMRSALQREMRRRLAASGVAARDPGRRQERLLAACCERGAELIETRIVSTWRVASTARRSLTAWAGKPGLAGTDPPPEVKSLVLEELAAWAADALGGLDRVHECDESYALEGIRFPRSL